jgi:hypothetical protein
MQLVIQLFRPLRRFCGCSILGTQIKPLLLVTPKFSDRQFLGDCRCPLWVISGHLQCKKACPLSTQEQTYAVQHRMSAKGQ